MAVTKPFGGWGGSDVNTAGKMIPFYWDSVFGENLYPSLFFYQFGAKRRVPPNYGLTIKISRLKRQTGVVKELSPNSYGVAFTATSATALCAQTISGTLAKFRGVYGNSDIALLTSLGDPTEFAIRDIARDLALQMDRHVRTKLSAVSNGFPLMYNATTFGSGLEEGTIKISDIIKAVSRLRGANNPRWPDGNFPFIVHPYVSYDIKSSLSTGHSGSWVEVNSQNSGENAEKVFRGEIGRLYGARVIESTEVKHLIATGGISANNSGWQNLMLAPESYYVAEMDQMTGRVIVKGLGSAGALDADNSLSTVAAKVFFTAIRGFQSADPTAAGAEFRYVRLITGSTLR